MSRALSMLFLLIAGHVSCASGALMRSHRSSVKHAATEGNVDDLREFFDDMDTDGSGSISTDEFRAYFSEDLSAEEIDILVQRFDRDGSGEIDFDEFCDAMNEKHAAPESKEDELREFFEELDTDGSGFLSTDELRAYFSAEYSDEELDKLIQSLDRDGDGEISFEEFCDETNHDEMLENFIMIDSDGSGFISKDELREYLNDGSAADLSDEELESVVQFFDKDGSGEISFEEFKEGLEKGNLSLAQRGARTSRSTRKVSRHAKHKKENRRRSPLSNWLSQKMADINIRNRN